MSLLHVEHVDGAVAGADLDQAVPDRFRGGLSGATGGFLEREAVREERREGRRVRAAGAVGRRHVVARDGNLDMPLAVEQVVDRVVAVAAGHDDRTGAELDDRLCQLGTCPGAWHRAMASQDERLVEVRRHDRREREEARDEDVDSVVLKQLRAAARDHHGVDGERHVDVGEVVRHRSDQLRGEEHPGLGGVDADVVEDRVELRADEIGRKLVHSRDGGRVLRRQRDEDARPVTAGGRKRLQVGLDAGPAAGIRRRDRECARNHLPPFAGITRIRFDGCDLSPGRGTPVARV
jgi:hypothetical protein